MLNRNCEENGCIEISTPPSKALNKLFLFLVSLSSVECPNEELLEINNPKLIFETVIIKLLNTKKEVEPIKIENIIKEEPKKKVKQELPKIELNENIDSELIEKLEKIRINNTLCNFNKKQLLEMKPKIEEIRIMLMNPQYSEIASLVLEGELKAMSEENMIFVYENDRLSKIFNEQILKIEELFNEVFNKKYLLISTNIENWNKIKEEFNSKKKKYTYMEEPIIKTLEKSDNNNIDKEFSDIIEYN